MSLAYRDIALPQCVCAENWNANRRLHKLNLMFHSSSLTKQSRCGNYFKLKFISLQNKNQPLDIYGDKKAELEIMESPN